MPVTNKNQIEPHNEGSGALTYWCKLNTIIAHLPILSIAEKTASVRAACSNIYLPTHIILLSLPSITRVKTRFQKAENFSQDGNL